MARRHRLGSSAPRTVSGSRVRRRCCERRRAGPPAAGRDCREPARRGDRPTRFRRAPCSRCRRRPGGACRGGSASSARRCAARARRSRTAGAGPRRACVLLSRVPREDMLRRLIGAREETMATLAYQFEEITPRQLKPELYELDGISREAVEAHYKLYEGYVSKRNEILGKLDGVDLSSANQTYSEIRALKIDLSFAIGGIKNHEIYFEHLGGGGGDPNGAIAGLIR